MSSVEHLTGQLRELGVRAGDVLVVHSSFRAVRPVADGPLGVITALRTALGDSGTLVMPSMTGGENVEPYDPRQSPTRNMGVVAETFWRLPGVLRGDHPTSTFAAVGPHAEQIVAPQPLSPPHGLDSPVGRAYELGGSVLLLGVGHDANTTMHLAEDLAGVPYKAQDRALVRDGDRVREVFITEPDHCCQGFSVADDWLRESGLQREGRVGNAEARLFAARDLVRLVVPRLTADPLRFLCAEGSGCEDCDAARSS
ncbi:AAC(3) family N-acetyltransferase [Allokutzneria sp. A3M-2-11 16]|uniref:AAC(3) family N-acetyltransferase n=1 Tax=Allokutzneria sp. A3M-2-11 16 TaxID=2962043 RepID=UPI0020B7FA63|nr:AAC(3) family N-acetyltransferase [Allokutzneria sp. A3M-2-11 16]MCP3802247.1 AAC(3) family N-acetyltransferase [Allokutzneria sp. A3M-2-11 16]